MSQHAIDLLIDSGLISASGKIINVFSLSEGELSERVSQYINGRIESLDLEISDLEKTESLSALYSTESSNVLGASALSSALVYQSIILDDPLVKSQESISLDELKKGLEFFAHYFNLIKIEVVKVYPLSFLNYPSRDVPFLLSEDAFRSSIPDELHDYIHENAIIKSAMKNDKGEFLILKELGSVNRRPALFVSFKDDCWRGGVQLYLNKTMEKIKNVEGGIEVRQIWEEDKRLDKKFYDAWSYQVVNQAMRVRLKNIYNETVFANNLGHTYVTESKFESGLLSLAGIYNGGTGQNPCRFIEANSSLLNISSPDLIVELREKYPVAFENFNSSLLYMMERLRETDEGDFEERSRLYFKHEILPQVEEIRSNAKSLRRSMASGTAMSLGGLAFSMILEGGPLPFMASLLYVASQAGPGGYEPFMQQRDFKKKPAYIWHRISKY
ncbi:hypothetical protein LG331_05230 [Vreelandella aquamarina]|uniref:hypothetical protein n=1 Tax=Vreelandella aquamarina TaxID=77097 RepID=UPI00384BF5F3